MDSTKRREPDTFLREGELYVTELGGVRAYTRAGGLRTGALDLESIAVASDQSKRVRCPQGDASKPPRERSALRWGVYAALCLAACGDATVIVGKLPPPVPVGRTLDAGRAPVDAADSGTSSQAGAGASVPPMTGAPPAVGARAPRMDTVSIESGPLSDFCQRTGSALTSTRMRVSACEARVEPSIFAYGLCACEELRTSSDGFLIDSFDSSTGPYRAGQTDGSVGLNSANLRLAESSQVLGSLWVAGDGALTLAAPGLVVSGDLKTNATLTVDAENQRIMRDLWTAADVVVLRGSLRVDRDLYQVPGRTNQGALEIAGQRQVADGFRVTAPCACGADALIDPAALVAQVRDHNDNAATSFDPGTLDVASLLTEGQTFPCGRLHAPTLTLQGASTYAISPAGRSALFIQGDLKVSSYSTLFINNSNAAIPVPIPTGDLDLFIAGDLIVEPSSTLLLGDPAEPAATRVFLAGQIKAEGAIQLAAHLYAPNATYASTPSIGSSELYGSIHARSIQLPTKSFHYDRAIAPTCSTQP